MSLHTVLFDLGLWPEIFAMVFLSFWGGWIMCAMLVMSRQRTMRNSRPSRITQSFDREVRNRVEGAIDPYRDQL